VKQDIAKELQAYRKVLEMGVDNVFLKRYILNRIKELKETIKGDNSCTQ